MEIHIKQPSLSGRWGKIYQDTTNKAMSVLSGDAFKWYIKLSLNRDGYQWNDNVPNDVQAELTKRGYLYSVYGSVEFNPVAQKAETDHNYQSGTSPEPQRVEYSPPVQEPASAASQFSAVEERRILDAAIAIANWHNGDAYVCFAELQAEVGYSEKICTEVIFHKYRDYFTEQVRLKHEAEQAAKPEPHYKPPATYENPGYSDMFVHVGADGRVQDEPEYTYTSDDLPF